MHFAAFRAFSTRQRDNFKQRPSNPQYLSIYRHQAPADHHQRHRCWSLARHHQEGVAALEALRSMNAFWTLAWAASERGVAQPEPWDG
jgi:hypothetical protein